MQQASHGRNGGSLLLSAFAERSGRQVGIVVRSESSVLIVVAIVALLAAPPPARTEDRSRPAAVPGQKARDESKRAAYERASVAPIQMGFDLTKYLGVTLDKDEPPDVLTDSDIAPFMVPVALQAD